MGLVIFPSLYIATPQDFHLIFIFLRATVCWPLLCLCRPLCDFKSCLSKQARYQLRHLSHPSSYLATHLPLSHPSPSRPSPSWNLEWCRHCGNPDTIDVGIRWLVHAHCGERAALHYVLPTRCRLCLGGKDGRPTQFNAAIACSVKLTGRVTSIRFKNIYRVAAINPERFQCFTVALKKSFSIILFGKTVSAVCRNIIINKQSHSSKDESTGGLRSQETLRTLRRIHMPCSN